MKKNSLLLITLLFIIVLNSCQEDESAKEVKALQEEFDITMKETIAIHDEVMPKMGEINKLLNELEQNKENFESQDYEDVTYQLKEAHQGMMTWMKDLSGTFNKDEINSGITLEDKEALTKKMKQLKEIKVNAETMKQKIVTSLEKGNMLNQSL